MCLILRNPNKKWIKKLKLDSKVVCWKVVHQQSRGKYSSPFWWTGNYSPGRIVQSNRMSTKITKEETRSERINLGIHVFLYRSAARDLQESCKRSFEPRVYRVIKVEVDVNDFVACNSQEAAFTKVKVIGKGKA